MITYVNTVLVGTGNGTVASSIADATAGQYIVTDNDGVLLTSASDAAKAEAIRVGLKNKKGIKWSNIIKKADLKSYSFAAHEDDTEDTVKIWFHDDAVVEGKRIVVRLTFKDMDTRYRKWSESYEHIVEDGKATREDVIDAFVYLINNKCAKRARVHAENEENMLVLTALPYDDDNMEDSISPANKVRFDANVWYTDPSATGFASKNKYSAANINKIPGKYFTASAKLVRDAEAQAMGYQGILNRGCCTWPIIKPDMNVDLDQKYDSLTLEFENMYRTADDLQRRTKQTLQIFEVEGKMATGVKAVIDGFVKGEHADAFVAHATSDTVNAQ